MESEMIYCTNCGSANEPPAKFCFKCGSPLKGPGSANSSARSSNFITLNCPNCGGKLEVTPDMERFVCKYCGNEHIVKHNGSDISLTPVLEGIKRVEQKFDHVLIGSDRIAAEQTIQRLKTEIVNLQKGCDHKRNELAELERKFGKESNYANLELLEPYKKNKTRNLLGLLFLIPIPIIFFAIAIFSATRPFFEWATHLELWKLAIAGYSHHSILFVFFALAIISLFAGIILLKLEMAQKNKSKRNARDLERKQLFQKKHEELDLAEAQLLDYQKKLEDLHRYTTER